MNVIDNSQTNRIIYKYKKLRPVAQAGASIDSNVRVGLLFAQPFDLGAQRGQFLIHLFVSTVNLADIADGRFALGRKGGQNQGHTGADIRAFHFLTVKAGGSLDDHAVRVAQDNLGAHADQFIGKKHPAGVHPIMKRTVPLDWVAITMAMLIKSVGKAGQGMTLISGMAPPRSGSISSCWLSGNENIIAFDLPVDTQAAKNQADHIQILGAGIADADQRLGDHCRANETDDFQVIGADGKFTAMQARNPVDISVLEPILSICAPIRLRNGKIPEHAVRRRHCE